MRYMTDIVYLLLVEFALLIAVAVVFALFPPSPRWLIIVGVVIGLLAGILVYDLTVDVVRKQRLKRLEKKVSTKEMVEMSPGEGQAAPQDEADEIVEMLNEGRRLLKEGNPEAALERFLAAKELEPSSSRIWNHIGLAYSKMGEFEDAIEAYQRAIALDFRNPSAHFNLALALERMERYKEALEAWKNYEMIGKILGEREDLLAGARKRIRELEEKISDVS